MKKLLALLALIAMTLGLVAAPPAGARTAAATVTLYSWSASGWASGWRYHNETPAYSEIHVSWTYRGTTGCNSGSDHFLVRILGHDPYTGDTITVKSGGEYGPEYNSSYSGGFVVSNSDYGFNENGAYSVALYVGPQAACSASVRVWEYA